MQRIMNTSGKKYNRITKHNRIQRRRYNRITITTVVTTICILATSITVIAAPMKQYGTEAQKKISLPGAGINKVVSDYAEVADEAEVSALVSGVAANEASSEVETISKGENMIASAARSLGSAIENLDAQTSHLDLSEPVFEEVYYEEPVVEEYYEEPVYEEDYAEETYEEEIYYEPETFLDEIFYDEEEPYYEDTYYEEDPYYEEPVYEEATLEEFLEEQEIQIEEQATEKKKKEKPAEDSGTYLGQIIANDACQYVGWLPYVWAGASLETGADCSGFTMAVYAKYGYYLSHDSEVQSCEGRSVPLSEALPGDIVVYSGHVAMYIGNGQIVHSPTPGQCVSIASVYMMPVLDVRRIID